ncbi:tetratricopeptide repeat protein [Candidatus Zixiibacteriota bacterium]
MSRPGTFLQFALSAVITALFLIPASNASAWQGGDDPHAALCDSGFVRLDSDDIEGARGYFEQILRRDPHYPRALLGMGRVMLGIRTGGGRAVDFLIQATEALPLDISAHYYRGLAHMRLAERDIGRDNIRMARSELITVLDLDPSHPDARYRLGIVLYEYFEEFREAQDEFEKQILTNPGHVDARLALLKVLMEMGEWEEAVSSAEMLLERDPEAFDAYPYLAGAQWKMGRGDEAMRVFERYFAIVGEREVNLYLNLGLVLETEEMEEFESLAPDGKRAYWAHYWRSRDPDPKTDVNERLLEHYIRIAWARIEFGKEAWPWDARGRLYVRYGEPDYRSGHGRPIAWDFVDGDPEWTQKKREHQEEMGLPSMLLQLSVFDADHWDYPLYIPKPMIIATAESLRAEDPIALLDSIWTQAVAIAENKAFRGASYATPERWVYADEGIDLNFEDYAHSGIFSVYGVRSRMVVEQMEERLPSLSEEEDRIEIIDPMDSVVTFRGEGGQTAVEYAFALLPDEFGSFRSMTGVYATIDVEVNLFTEDWIRAAGVGDSARRLETIPQVSIRGIPLFVDATRMEVTPGTYLLTTLLIDPETGKRARAEETVELPDYSGDELMMSNILPAAYIGLADDTSRPRFIRGDLEVLPLPGRAIQADQALFIYYEVYNLSMDQFGATEYQVEYLVREAPENRRLATRLFHTVQSFLGQGRRPTGVASSVTRTGIRPDLFSYLEIDVSQLEPQTYILELHVTDLNNGEMTSGSLLFRTLPPMPGRGG